MTGVNNDNGGQSQDSISEAVRPQVLIYTCSFILYVSSLLIYTGLNAAEQAPSETSYEASFRFTNRSAHTVEDRDMGLLWQRCTFGRYGESCEGGDIERLDWNAAVVQASEYRQVDCQTRWRLPSLVELHSLVREDGPAPTINEEFFPKTEATWYWTATAYDLNSLWIRVVSFYDRSEFDSMHSNAGVMRLVCSEFHQLG